MPLSEHKTSNFKRCSWNNRSWIIFPEVGTEEKNKLPQPGPTLCERLTPPFLHIVGEELESDHYRQTRKSIIWVSRGFKRTRKWGESLCSMKTEGPSAKFTYTPSARVSLHWAQVEGGLWVLESLLPPLKKLWHLEFYFFYEKLIWNSHASLVTYERNRTHINIIFIYRLPCTVARGYPQFKSSKRFLKINQDRKQAPIPIWNLHSRAF